jgi:hypothetical protein|tara:strand:- start:407 stop:517 length:111 start_codon:yes stop_codon:yes gene_type:complete
VIGRTIAKIVYENHDVRIIVFLVDEYEIISIREIEG